MTSALDNLTGPGKPLKAEPPDASELEGLRRSGLARLKDARNQTLSLESRFDLAYNAAHALSLAALRRLATHTIAVLNIAGPRESKRPGVYQQTMDFLQAVHVARM